MLTFRKPEIHGISITTTNGDNLKASLLRNPFVETLRRNGQIDIHVVEVRISCIVEFNGLLTASQLSNVRRIVELCSSEWMNYPSGSLGIYEWIRQDSQYRSKMPDVFMQISQGLPIVEAVKGIKSVEKDGFVYGYSEQQIPEPGYYARQIGVGTERMRHVLHEEFLKIVELIVRDSNPFSQLSDEDKISLQAEPISGKRMALLWYSPPELAQVEQLLAQVNTVTLAVKVSESLEARTYEITQDDFQWAKQIEPIVDKAEAASRQEKYSEAIQYYKEALKLAPGSDMLLMSIGSCYSILGQKALGLQYLERAAQISPDNDRIRNNLARARRENEPASVILFKNKSDAETVEQAIDELIALYDGSPNNNPERNLVRDIGLRLDELGGLQMMLLVHREFALSRPGAARNLERCWDGIGDWQG